MERVHQQLAAGTINDWDVLPWNIYWQHIASAKVPLEKKIATYQALRSRGLADLNDLHIMELYEMVRADRAFVAALDLDKRMGHCCQMFIMWIDDDAAALTTYYQKRDEDNIHPRIKLELTMERYVSMVRGLHSVMMTMNAPRCMRGLCQNQSFRESLMRKQMSPVGQRIVEELVQPADQLDRNALLVNGQSVKLIGMCVKDEELVESWLDSLGGYPRISLGHISVMFARKLHALATPEQGAIIASDIRRYISVGGSNDGCFELAWLFGLLGPFDSTVQQHFRKSNVSLFPALTFAMIVAMCDGYLEMTSAEITPQKRFFDFAARLPMDLQALVSLRLWDRASTVIQGDKFNRALLAIL
jgi:hypothetical protein